MFSILAAVPVSLVVMAAASPLIMAKIESTVETKLEERIPALLRAATDEAEKEKQMLVVEANLKGWELAEEGMPENRNIYGSPDAEFSLVEYSDFECSFCKRFHDTPKKMVMDTAGRVNWEWQHLPMPFHNPVSTNASHASLCVSETAGNRAFWAFTDLWFSTSGQGGRGVPDVTALAEGVGAPAAEFTACMDSGKYNSVIEAQGKKAAELGVTGTPGTFVVDNTTGNRLFVRGAQPASALIGALRQLQDMRETSAKEGDS